MSTSSSTPIILITGASGNIGSALCRKLRSEYYVIGLDIQPCEAADENLECDLTSEDSVKLNLLKIREKHGQDIAAVIHLAAYFDFTGEDHPLYTELNVEGTKHLLHALQAFDVERFIYSSTMLVHEALAPGRKVNEETAMSPAWAYPQSKADAEKVVQQFRGAIPYTILRLAGIYDDQSAVPTLTYQIARIYERKFKSRLYAGDMSAGQAFIHKDDMLAVFQRVVEKRDKLPSQNIFLAGEEETMGYQALQNRIGSLVFGASEWATYDIPEFIAKPGAWVEEKAEPIIPDAFDQGKKPFIKPFMIDLASDHYELDISHAKEALDWRPQHKIYDGLEKLIENLKADPNKWYAHNGIVRPDWMQTAEEKNKNPNELRTDHENIFRRAHSQFIWAHFLNAALALWLCTAPYILGYQSEAMIWSNIGSGAVLLIVSLASLSWRLSLARWMAGGVGLWLLAAPLIFWAPTAAAYLNDTLVGMLVIGFSVCSRPTPGVSAVAAETGPNTPPGWDFNPSAWVQRMPIIFLAVIGFLISRYLCAYQLGHIDSIWEPFFEGAGDDPKNGTEEIITSSISEAWPVPDAGLGAMTYALEILTGIMGSVRRWRTMPWLVMLFGIMIVPLGAVSIFFIIIQPILIGTWCTLCLIAAAAMLIQIPYSLDELIATSEFLYRRKGQGRPLLRIFFIGDTDDGDSREDQREFERRPRTVIADMLGGGVTLPWNLALCIPVGIWLMFTRLTVNADTSMANADHLIGSLALTVVVTSLAESGRAVRFLLIPLGSVLFVTPFLYGAEWLSTLSSVVCGALLIALSIRRGEIRNRYGLWDKAVV